MPIDIAKIVSQQQKRYKSDFKEISKIGKGGFSKVYRVENEFDGQEYAIKKIILNVKDIKDNNEVLLERFLREARFLARINHPRIIRYYNSWVEVIEKERQNQRSFEENYRVNNFSCQSPSIHKEQEIIFFYDDPQDSTSLENLVDFQPPKQSSNTELEGRRHTIIGKCEEACLRKSIKRNPEHQNRLGDLLSYSEDLELNEQNLIIEKRPSRKTLNMKKSTSQECKKNTQEKRNEGLLDQYESLILYIQTEICKQTLDDYLLLRNSKLLKLKKHNLVAFKSQEEDYIREARKILSQIIDGLQHMHKNRLIHRDLKPGNIFMNSPDDVKIGDFGLVKKIMEKLVENPTEQSTESQDEMNSSNFCTKLYASPEQINNSSELQKYDHRIDIHALGLIILQLFHPMNTQMEIIKTLQDASLKGILPDNLLQLPIISQYILKCLKRDVNLRPSLEDIQIEICNLGASGFSTTTTMTTRQEYSPIKQTLQVELNGFINIKFEGSNSFKSKKYYLKCRKLFIYKYKELEKAQLVYNLDDCKCSIDKFNLIRINHPELIASEISFPNEVEASTFFRQIQFGNDFINHQHIVEDDY